MSHPKVSIVTINYNMANDLEATIKSVLEQSYPNIEYIVIDGGSKDSSVGVIRSFSEQITHWVSERDTGRYDAMNKGARAATGDWVLFMNSGDRFHDPDSISDMFLEPQQDADLLYGHVLRRYPHEGIDRIVLAGDLNALPLQMPCCHQSLFTRRDLLLEHPFSANFPISFDHEFMLWAKRRGARFKRLDRVVSLFTKGGASDLYRMPGLKEMLAIMRLHGALTPGVAIRYASFLLRSLAGPAAKRVLPPPLTRWLLLRKNFD